MAIEYLGLAHVAFFTNDYDSMYDFYVNQLGGRHVFHMTRNCWPEGEPFWPEGTQPNDVWLTYICFGNQFIELFNEGYSGENTFGARSEIHFCLEVGSLLCMVAQLREKGVRVYESPNGPELSKPIIEYPLDACRTRRAYVQDPEGNWIELMQFVPSSLQLTC